MIAEPVAPSQPPVPSRRRRRLVATGIFAFVAIVGIIIGLVVTRQEAPLASWVCRPMEIFVVRVTQQVGRTYARQGCLVADLRPVPLTPSDPDRERETRQLLERAIDAWYDRLTDEPRLVARPVVAAVDVTVLEPNADLGSVTTTQLRMNELSTFAMNEALSTAFGSIPFRAGGGSAVGPSPKDPSVWILRIDEEEGGDQLFCGIEVPAAGAVVETLRGRCVIFGPSQLEM